MGWVYKSKNKTEDKVVSGVLPICPKCHYILMIREGERPLYCPMCGNKNLEDGKAKKSTSSKNAK